MTSPTSVLSRRNGTQSGMTKLATLLGRPERLVRYCGNCFSAPRESVFGPGTGHHSHKPVHFRPEVLSLPPLTLARLMCFVTHHESFTSPLNPSTQEGSSLSAGTVCRPVLFIPNIPLQDSDHVIGAHIAA